MIAKFYRVFSVVVIIISAMVIVWNGIWICIAGFGRECDRIKITDDNREKIASIVKDDYNQTISNMNQVKEIERFVQFRDINITVYYEDGTFHAFYVDKVSNDAFHLLMQDEGYNVYFRSQEFAGDIMKIVIPLLYLIGAVLLFRQYKAK